MVSRSAILRRALLTVLALRAPLPVSAEAARPIAVVDNPAPQGLPEDHAPWPVRAGFIAPTDCYPHAILDRVQGWGGLVVDLQLCPACGSGAARVRIDLLPTRIFEDLAPRLWDVTGGGRPEVVVVESDADLGARLAIREAVEQADGPGLRLLAAAPFIGTRFR